MEVSYLVRVVVKLEPEQIAPTNIEIEHAVEVAVAAFVAPEGVKPVVTARSERLDK